eukprot:scaffold547_cov384-Prasinococcus_capsulatus_cf.AAC.3
MLLLLTPALSSCLPPAGRAIGPGAHQEGPLSRGTEFSAVGKVRDGAKLEPQRGCLRHRALLLRPRGPPSVSRGQVHIAQRDACWRVESGKQPWYNERTPVTSTAHNGRAMEPDCRGSSWRGRAMGVVRCRLAIGWHEHVLSVTCTLARGWETPALTVMRWNGVGRACWPCQLGAYHPQVAQPSGGRCAHRRVGRRRAGRPGPGLWSRRC